jgi:predicted amidohydrolase YtcJ
MDASQHDSSLRRLITADAVVTGEGTIGDSILIEDGTIVGVGAKADLDTEDAAERAYVGATIIPGLRDAHIHPAAYAALLHGCSLKQANDIQDLQHRLAAYAATLPEGHPVVATRLDDETLTERRFPTRAELDAAVKNRPVVVYRYCGHVAVANTAGLAASGITSDTPSPVGGSIDHDMHGSPTGVLRETAMELIPSSLGWGGDPDDAALISALLRLASVGITSIGAIVACGERLDEQREVALWARVAARLPIKVHAITSAETSQHLQQAADTLTGVGPRLRWLGVKRYADGSLGGYTAAMNAPYANGDSRGILRLSEFDAEIARQSIDLGGMVAIHAIGDRAVDGVLDIFESLIGGGADPRALRMEHASVVSPHQIARFADLGVSAVVQPAFLASESSWVAGRVGAERETWLYPFRSLVGAGVLVAGSSDCPVEPPRPLWGMAAAIDRHGINDSERLSGTGALALFTSCAASVLREPEPLAIGSPADIVIIDADPTTASADEIRHAHVIDTYVDGVAVVFDDATPVWPD